MTASSTSVDMPPTSRALPAFGFAPRPWMSVDYPNYDLVGRFESASFSPAEWKPMIPNVAFLNARPDDLSCGARRLRTIMTDEMIRAAVRAGKQGDPEIDEVGAAQKEWTEPVRAWFKRTIDGWKLVGFERLQGFKPGA